MMGRNNISCPLQEDFSVASLLREMALKPSWVIETEARGGFINSVQNR